MISMSKIPELLNQRASWLRKQAQEELTQIEALGYCANHLLEKAAEQSKSQEVAKQFLDMVKQAGVDDNLSTLVCQVQQKMAINPFDVAAAKIAEAAKLGTITKEAAEAVLSELQRRKANENQ